MRKKQEVTAMAQHEDELNMRQQKREALRKKREAEQRKMKLALILAVILLIACGMGIFFLAKKAGIQPGATPMEEEQIWQTEKATEATEATTPKKSPLTTIHIKAAGDLNVTTSVVNAGLAPNGFNFTNAFVDVASTMASADLTVMNFEGNIYGQEYGTETTVAPRELLDGLRSMGVDMIQTANSASINNGLIGLSSTLSAVRHAGMVPLGSYASSGEFQQSKGYTMCEIQGIRVALVAFTKGVGGKGMPAGNEDCVNLLYLDYEFRINSRNFDVLYLCWDVPEGKVISIADLKGIKSGKLDLIASFPKSRKKRINFHIYRYQKSDLKQINKI